MGNPGGSRKASMAAFLDLILIKKEGLVGDVML